MSTEYVVELIQMPVNDAFSAQPELFAKLREGGAKGGITSQAYGLAIENPSMLSWIIHFESGIVPKTYQWPEEYGDFPEAVGKISTAPPKSLFAPLKSPFPKSITDAPVTELATLSLKPSANKAEYTKLMDVHLAENVVSAPGARGTLWAFATKDLDCSLEMTDTVVAFVGRIAQAHTKAAQTDAFKVHSAGLAPFVAGAIMVHINAANV